MPKLCNHSRIKSRRKYEATPEEDIKLRQLAAKGYSCYRICQIMKISQSVGQRWLAERDLTPSARRPAQCRALKTNEEAELRRLCKQGYSVGTMAKNLKMGEATVRRALKALSLVPDRATNKNHCKASAASRITINAQEGALYRKRKGEEELPRESIAARFRRQGLTVADPNR